MKKNKTEELIDMNSTKIYIALIGLDRQWEIVVHHMLVRANLTADEHQSILEFLKAAN